MWFPTEPLDIIDAPADMFHMDSRVKLKPRRIIMHATAGTNSLDWLTTTSIPPVSAHRLIDRRGRIFKLVDDRNIAYHAGNGPELPTMLGRTMNPNYTSLGLELENLNNGKQVYSAPQLESAIRQVVEWYGTWGYLPIFSHADLDARKSDPVRFPWEPFMVLVWDRVASLVDH